LLKSFDEQAIEPLLQHYGLSTTWIDIVDNIWVALWFSCHKCMSMNSGTNYWHFEKRMLSDTDQYAYILLIATDTVDPNKNAPGIFLGKNTELIDLRIATPSIFLRPHSQHGLLFRKKATKSGRTLDYYDQIRDILRIHLKDAAEWLGIGKMLDAHSLFPPPYYDNGYNILLSNNVSINSNIGSIAYIGP
jgi:hypothetical protein